ncbi:MAG: hypothetical protein LUD82_09990 [Clostridiales bacterium]|nr:hypothetical protein [Clostridiales bacterium]
MRKRILESVLLVLFIVLAGLWIWRYRTVNRSFEEKYSVPTVSYGLNDEIELGENIIELGMTADGYTLIFQSWELLEYDEALEKYGVSEETAADFYYPPERVLIVSVTVYNEDNTDSVIPLYDLTLCGTDWYTDWNEEFMAAINDDGWNILYSCGVGETEQIYLVYDLRESKFPEKRWESLSEESFFIQLTYRPVKISVKLQ